MFATEFRGSGKATELVAEISNSRSWNVRKVVFLSSTAILSLAAFANPAMAQEPAAAASAQSEAGQNDTNQLESIVVTARRVEENQQKVPVAVTTLTASAL